jgi:DNA-binding XRE family transcriptional regulator
MVKCRYCQSQIHCNANFCGVCGNRVQADTVPARCPEIDPKGAKYCFECGQQLLGNNIQSYLNSVPYPVNLSNQAQTEAFDTILSQVKSSVDKGCKRKMNYNLKRLRDKHALSLTDLELICGVDRTTIYRIENGRQKARSRTIRKLAKAFQVKPEELI